MSRVAASGRDASSTPAGAWRTKNPYRAGHRRVFTPDRAGPGTLCPNRAGEWASRGPAGKCRGTVVGIPARGRAVSRGEDGAAQVIGEIGAQEGEPAYGNLRVEVAR